MEFGCQEKIATAVAKTEYRYLTEKSRLVAPWAFNNSYFSGFIFTSIGSTLDSVSRATDML
jgi:hypothetical protein